MRAIVLIVLALFFAPHMVRAQTAEPFGVRAGSLGEDDLRGSLGYLLEQHVVFDACTVSILRCPPEKRRAAAVFKRIVEDARSRTGLTRIRYLNRAVDLAFKATGEVCASARTWADPLDSIGEGCGDCKAQAIAKYMGLLELGFASEDLRIVVGRRCSMTGKPCLEEAHVVIAVLYQNKWMVLDNTDPFTVLEDRAVHDFVADHSLRLPDPLGRAASN